jgi:hypothetical protein
MLMQKLEFAQGEGLGLFKQLEQEVEEVVKAGVSGDVLVLKGLLCIAS